MLFRSGNPSPQPVHRPDPHQALQRPLADLAQVHPSGEVVQGGERSLPEARRQDRAHCTFTDVLDGAQAEADRRRAIGHSLEERFTFLMKQLKIADTANAVARFVTVPHVAIDRESEIVSELVTATNTVISLGGGAILRTQNRQAIRQGGLVVWLQADPHTIASRLHADAATAARRPALTHHDPLTEIRTLLEQRRPLYAECAGHIIDTEQKSLDDCVDEIVCLLNNPSRKS